MYYLYSCTKIITCTAVMQLIERGMIHLYDPVCNYLPEYEVMRIAVSYTHLDVYKRQIISFRSILISF